MPGWLSRNNFTAGEAMSHVYLNNLANDIRAWGGDVNGGGYTLSNAIINPISITRAGTLGLAATGSNVITFSTNGAERVRVTAAGDVGIGTGSPVGALDVVRSAADVTVRAYTGAVDMRMWAYHAGAGIIGTNTAHPLIFAVGSLTERMRITTAGEVGIGTNGPSARLHVFGHVSNEVARFQPRNDAANNRSFVSLYTTNPAYWWELSVEDASGGGTANGLALRERSGSGSSVVRAYFPAGGGIVIPGLSVYASNFDATTAGLTAGRLYRTSTGVLMQVY